MHTVFFGIKRVHIEVVHRLTRPLLEACVSGLTPARFDLMRIVQLRPHGILQGTLQWLLGVSAPTTSRMLKSLEQLGMVTRGGALRDGRCRMVYITPHGREAVERALRATVENRENERSVARCATGDKDRRRYRRSGDRDPTATIDSAAEKVEQLERVLAGMRKALLDRTPFRHPWQERDAPPYKYHVVVDGMCRYGDEWPLDPNWNPTF